MVLGKKVAISIGNGAKIRPLEKGRKSHAHLLFINRKSHAVACIFYLFIAPFLSSSVLQPHNYQFSNIFQ